MDDKPLVSIDCITYNQEKYIARTIDSFLMQKTNFNYEILIHDDASTDNTPEIIKRYEKKYPRKIRVIYQKENQYSQGKDIWSINSARAAGKYITLCEGDDFWIDPLKLQKQVEYMENNPKTSVIVHSAIVVDAQTSKKTDHIRPSKESRYFSTEEVIAGDGGLVATNSMLFRRKYFKNLPKFYKNCPVGDYPLMIHLALEGKVYYLDEYMSAYQINTGISWTDDHFTNHEKIVKHYQEINETLDQVNVYTNYKFNKTIENRKSKNHFTSLMLQGKFEEMRNKEYKNHYQSLSNLLKAKLFMKEFFPNLYDFSKNIQLRFRRPIG